MEASFVCYSNDTFAGTLAKSLAKRVGKATGKAGESSGILASFLSEILKASKMIRIYQKENKENSKAGKVIDDLVKKYKNWQYND